MHQLLSRQLKRCLGVEAVASPALARFLEAVDLAYREADDDRRLLERSLELSSREMVKANADLSAVLNAFPDLFFRIDLGGRILDCRGGHREEFLVSPETLIGKRIQDVPHRRVRDAFRGGVALVSRYGNRISVRRFHYHAVRDFRVHPETGRSSRA